MKNLEAQQQAIVFQILALNEAKWPKLAWVHSSQNGVAARSMAAAARRKQGGQKAGIADLCIPFASHDRAFPGAYIEMKIRPNRPTAKQIEFLDFVRSEGYATAVAYSAQEVLEFVENYMDIKLRGKP